MNNILTITQIVVSLVLIVLILVQARGTGLGRGSAGSFSRRGAERLIFRLTFVFTALFLIISVLQIF